MLILNEIGRRVSDEKKQNDTGLRVDHFVQDRIIPRHGSKSSRKRSRWVRYQTEAG